MPSLVRIFAEPQHIHEYGGGKPNEINLSQTFLCLTSLQYMHIVKLISSFALFSWQRDKKNKESALVRCPPFPIFSKFCKQSKCHSKFKVSNSLQIVLREPSINLEYLTPSTVLKVAVLNQSNLLLKIIFQVKHENYQDNSFMDNPLHFNL